MSHKYKRIEHPYKQRKEHYKSAGHKKAYKKYLKSINWDKRKKRYINEITDNISKEQINKEVAHLIQLRAIANQKYLASKQEQKLL